jgi:hypothetical protein
MQLSKVVSFELLLVPILFDMFACATFLPPVAIL